MRGADDRVVLPTFIDVVPFMDRRAWFLLACAVLIPWQLFHVCTHPQFYRPPLPIGDGPDYDTIGYSLSIGQGFAFAWNDAEWKAAYLKDALADEYPHLHRDARSGATTSRPPLVPLVLAGIYRVLGHNATSFAVFRCLSALAIGMAGSLAVRIAFDIGNRIARDRWTSHLAAIAALVFAFLDNTIKTYAVDFLSEPLALVWTTLFLTVGLHLENHRHRTSRNIRPTSLSVNASQGVHRDDVNLIANHLPSGFPSFHVRLLNVSPIILLAVCMAAMIATRSMFVFWLPGMALILLFSLHHRPGMTTIVFMACVALLLCPWWIRNCHKLGALMPMGAQGAVSLLGGYSDEALSDQGNWHPDAQDRLEKRLLARPDADKWSNLELEKKMAVAASLDTRQWIRQHVSDLPTLIGLRLKTHWGPFHGKSLIWRLGMLLGAIELIIHRRSEAYWLLGIPIVSSLTVMCLYETGGRFLVPLYGLLYALAGVGVAYVPSILFQACVSKRRKMIASYNRYHT